MSNNESDNLIKLPNGNYLLRDYVGRDFTIEARGLLNEIKDLIDKCKKDPEFLISNDYWSLRLRDCTVNTVAEFNNSSDYLELNFVGWPSGDAVRFRKLKELLNSHNLTFVNVKVDYNYTDTEIPAHLVRRDL